ncbi:cupin domain-containing protein [Janibacter melonis]|uniref:cupin domain-containing protein n=1 Tax=Janibacter melonis TaxID=262209 RepID=UPI0017874848|nr:cupin domain-containing protein [Janibacter melonis]
MTVSSEPTDQGPKPFVVNIERATLENSNFRTTLWTGANLQLTVMSIAPGDDIGLEVHDDHDQFLRVESGEGRVQMGPARDDLSFDRQVGDDDVVLVPAGSWHNITNTGVEPLQVYSLYGPPDHVHGTVHATKADEAADPTEH